MVQKVVKEWLNQARIEVFEWPSQSPDIENMWTVLKKQVCARKPTNVSELHQFCQEEWLTIQPDDYQKLVDGYQKHLTEVEMVKGHLNKYMNYCMSVLSHYHTIRPTFNSLSNQTASMFSSDKVVHVLLISPKKNESWKNYCHSRVP